MHADVWGREGLAEPYFLLFAFECLRLCVYICASRTSPQTISC